MQFKLFLVVALIFGVSDFATPHFARVQAQELKFEIAIGKQLKAEELNGRALVMLSQRNGFEPRKGPLFVKPEPIFARDVSKWDPTKPIVIDSTNPGFPSALKNLPKGRYAVQAVFDWDTTDYHEVGTAPGNGYSTSKELILDPATTGTVVLTVDKIVPEIKFRETKQVKEVEIESKLLTAFHGRKIKLQAAVILPDSYAAGPDKKFPVVYEIPGFGGTHHMVDRIAARKPTKLNDRQEVVWVMLNGMCRTGHHEFADSANNGPYGQALLEELIPEIESRFRVSNVPQQRLLTGHSSGGWSSLWLQITYPDFFGGTWSTAPDPVDFRDFQRINIYRDKENAYTDNTAALRPIARAQGRVLQLFKTYCDMDNIVGRGGQLDSFDAVFSPRGADGRPLQLWNRETGTIDPKVASEWQKYDIRLILENNWEKLGPKLKGKLHVYTGAEDTFYLEGAVKLLAASLKKLNSDAVVEVFPGRDHSNLMGRDLRERIAREMAKQLQ